MSMRNNYGMKGPRMWCLRSWARPRCDGDRLGTCAGQPPSDMMSAVQEYNEVINYQRLCSF
jgi:hypothetical protein